MHKESSVKFQGLMDANAVKVKFLCQVSIITSFLYGLSQDYDVILMIQGQGYLSRSPKGKKTVKVKNIHKNTIFTKFLLKH